MYPQYWTPSMGVFLCPRSSIASQEISATFKQHPLRHAIRSCCQRIKYANCYRTRRKRKIRTLLQSETGSDFSCLVGAGGFEPPKLKAADLQSVPIGHSGTRPYSFCVRCRTTCLVYHRFLDLSTSFFISFSFIAIFKNSAGQNGIFAICSLRMLLVH